MLDEHTIVLLRGFVPYRRLMHQESLYYAEQQAMVLLKLAQVHEPPVPVEELAELGLAAEIRDDPTLDRPGRSEYDPEVGEWIIRINPDQRADTRAFVIAHEIKHILDDGFGKTLYRPIAVMTVDQRQEHAANFFALCLLSPREWVEREWRRAHGNIGAMAKQFGMLPERMALRLEALRLLDDEPDRH